MRWYISLFIIVNYTFILMSKARKNKWFRFYVFSGILAGAYLFLFEEADTSNANKIGLIVNCLVPFFLILNFMDELKILSHTGSDDIIDDMI